jgi:ubiquinone/menaquinone biosynthesis C-methylase UbiE
MIQGVAEVREAYRDDAVASAYVDERFREPLGALLHERQANALRWVIGRSQPDRVLEIAPGPARLTVDVAPLLDRPPVLIDASPQMLAEANRRLTAINRSATLVDGDAFDLPFPKIFDLVYTFRLIRHFEDADRARLYAQIARVLRPGGLLVFDAVNEVVSRPLREQSGPGAHRHFDALLTAGQLRTELVAQGFEVQRLIGVQHRYPLLVQAQILLGPRSRSLARAAMELIDRSGGEPLEWIVVCRRK